MENLGGPDADVQAPLSAPMRVYRTVLVGAGGIAALLFAAMAILVCADVFLRNVGIMSIAWSVEATEYMLMVSAFLAAPWLVYTNDHIRVDILVRDLPAHARRIVGMVGDMICWLICVALALQSLYSTADSAEQGGVVFKVLVFPDWWLGVPMVICFVLLVVEFTRRLAQAVLNPGVL